MSSIHTGIEWTDKTWNPTTGCDKISTGCLHCYAEAITQRFPKNFPNGFTLTLHRERLEEPLRWRTPSRVFVNSMSDLFHDDVPLDFIRQVFSVIHSTPWHIYQILTKRQSRLGDLASKLDFPENIWLGVSVENQNHIDRIEYLRTVPVSVRFISCEPLLGPLELNLTGIDWVIVGGESGQKHRQMKLDWARDIRDQCQNSGVAFFFKQVGGRTPKAGGRLLDDKIWDEMPNAWNQHIQTWGSVPLKSARRSEKLELIA
ncbi:phage Gp37Gp68 protein [Microcystis aeruginosa NIES-3804]|jgi:protein gp37|uniref:Phage Gp37Gp68 protein n=2 Tax=Microcystis aeruginosa TaxID=1126 RepID=A0A6H9GGS4_MICAE|nr:phage Gp37/Gp68 family protein [Microcystis aeruginosa]MDB9390588.1 phage Gp37/Gp68 family protein [Microcystis aeruginosa CS-579]TRT54657.1 MAG: phage Gp37/Gp68 family protein [Microcystis aeruginosa Ma_QC_C_20070703_M131]GCL49927.1 phage Gp37Gp68 protein [Microcystis aeruginosa NIES-3804]